ncbi:hypothetical protein K493DRAFT_347649 [Basidiobolus meristosporus CBS 931.73]|uniref:Uncharacterized protein n=1 Tax=Basidiobolus meristosporus CBS 931.73 TaxID=1314790 RepID=A0A1Y1YS37_9FUNG|nr:hypothetical protein K493DRAFT_347649 [Basidiobolus meristosporus CBS 931.73]|eukprot:ORY00848.1 hypothetical protein K493DRAFT_347649 [Basidiobolus meristosporus CBS 931.73]
MLPATPVSFHGSCQEIPSLDEKFRVFNCKSPDTCMVGYVEIQRVNKDYCEEAKKIDYSPSPVHQEYFGRIDGPDTFYVNFTGAQKLAVSEWQFREDCSYRFPYTFHNSGAVQLSITHVYDGFRGVNEVSQEWPEYLGNVVVQDHEDTICPQCPATNTSGLQSNESTSICDDERPVRGAWVPWQDTALSTSGYLWSPLGCVYTHKIKPIQERACLANPRSILFTGDSQIRVTYDNIWRRFDGQLGRINTLNRFLDRKKVIKNVTLYHHKDVFLEDIAGRTPAELLTYDTIVFNFAQWPASGPNNGGHWTTEKFLSRLTNVTDYLAGIRDSRPKGKPLRLIWHGIHAFSTTNPYSKSRIDWRTNPRLKNWNVFAEDIMKGHGIRSINSFQITYPMIDTSPDKAHYFGTDAEEAIVDETLHKLDLCEPVY